ncbi:MAG: hypothetical protein U1F49_05360 [Rubrivivax sp.]
MAVAKTESLLAPPVPIPVLPLDGGVSAIGGGTAGDAPVPVRASTSSGRK